MNVNTNEHWVKLDVKILRSDLYADHSAWRVFTTMLLLAHHKDDFTSVRFKGKQRQLKAGEFCISRLELADLCSLPPSTTRNAINRLKEDKRVDSKSDNKKTIFTVVNWKKYQGERTGQRTATGQQEDNKRTTRGQHNRGLKDNKIKDNKINSIDKSILGDSPVAYGKPEINTMFDYWKETVGYAVPSRTQKNRNACNNLLKKHGEDGLRRLIDGVAIAQGDRFAPTISDFCSLQDKLGELIVWGRKKGKGNAAQF